MGEFLKSARFKLLVCILIMFVAFMFRAAWTGGLSPMLEQVTGMIVTPLQKGASAISATVSGYFQRYVQADEISAENETLRQQINELRSQLVEYETYKRENSTLRQFLDIKEDNPDFELEPAAVIARDQYSRFDSFTIDKGTLNGVNLRNPVICPDGLVGVVEEVGANYAKVTTLLDVSFNVGAYDVRTHDIGNVSGDITLAAEKKCKMSYLPRESGVSIGDLIVTTGSGGFFPKNLVVGEISRIDNGSGGISLYAVITPAADIPALTDVMVIKSFEGQEAGDK